MLYKKVVSKNKHAHTHTHTEWDTHTQTEAAHCFASFLAWHPCEFHDFFLSCILKVRTCNTIKWLLHVALFETADWVGLPVGFGFTHLYVYKYANAIGI